MPWHGNASSITTPLCEETTDNQDFPLKGPVMTFVIVKLNKLLKKKTIWDAMPLMWLRLYYDGHAKADNERQMQLEKVKLNREMDTI